MSEEGDVLLLKEAASLRRDSRLLEEVVSLQTARSDDISGGEALEQRL